MSLKKTIQGAKGGEAAYKVLSDNSYLNASGTVPESIKIIEDAIAGSGANEEERQIFQIGLNCEADHVYNKDPKDPNKYEQEGQKVLFESPAMIDYYVKLLQEHPLVTYIEDAFACFDFDAHKAFREKL